jgi:hypothetical protein
MRYYILRSDGCYVAFEGMFQETIISMLQTQGLTCQFIFEEEFNEIIRQKQLEILLLQQKDL